MSTHFFETRQNSTYHTGSTHDHFMVNDIKCEHTGHNIFMTPSVFRGKISMRGIFIRLQRLSTHVGQLGKF